MKRLSREPKFLVGGMKDEDEDTDFLDGIPEHVIKQMKEESRFRIEEDPRNARIDNPRLWLQKLRKPVPTKPPKVETPKTVYDRKRDKKKAQEETEQEDVKWGDKFK